MAEDLQITSITKEEKYKEIIPQIKALVEGELDFYFMHSYAVVDSNQLYATSICEYGEEFISSIEKDNITAVQFHPEKSHDTGIKLLNHWLKKNVKN